MEKIYMRYSDGRTRFVTKGQSATWVPGHKLLLVDRVAYINPPSSEVWLVSPDGRSIRKVTSVYPDQVRFFAVGHRGPENFLVYDTDKRGLQIRYLSGGKPLTLAVNGFADHLAVSPNGSQIAFVAEGSSKGAIPATFYLVDARGSAHLKPVLPYSPYREFSIISGLSWSPNGHWLALTLTANKGYTNFLTAIWLVHPDGTNLHMLTRGDQPAWSPDGAWIAYIGSRAQREALFKIHPDGTGRTQLTPFGDTSSGIDDSSQPSW